MKITVHDRLQRQVRKDYCPHFIELKIRSTLEQRSGLRPDLCSSA